MKFQTKYFNNAATSYPKPCEVADAVHKFISEGANVSRGSASERDILALRLVYECREALAEFFSEPKKISPQNVTFTKNVTESLNTVLRGFLKPGMSVLTSDMEHNAVVRPLRRLEKSGVRVTFADMSKKPDVRDFDLVVMTHASNVCGTIFDIETVGRACEKSGVPFVVDAAQTAGVLPIDVVSFGISALCFTGHKGLFAPQGIGGIVWNRDFHKKVSPLIDGGTGSYSHIETQPDDMPDKFEAGTPNLPGIAGLRASLEWIAKIGMDKIAAREHELGGMLLDGLKKVPGITLYGRSDMQGRLPVFAFNSDRFDNGSLAEMLSDAGFETRPGLHCAPVAHRTLGSFPEGALRVSPGFFNTEDEIENFLEEVKKCTRFTFRT